MSAPALLLAPSLTDHQLALARDWAQQLQLALTHQPSSTGFYLLYDTQGLALANADEPRTAPLRVDLLQGVLPHRLRFGGGRGQAVAKACGLKAGIAPDILDATAGLATDALVLNSLGCRVQAVERHPWVHALVADALQRARRADAATLLVDLSRFRLVQAEAGDYLDQQAGQADAQPQVVYLDPMFPEADKSAAAKKGMAFFRQLVGHDTDADALLPKALAVATHRVVVKRPRKAPWLARQQPSYSLTGQANRFDIYVKQSFKTT